MKPPQVVETADGSITCFDPDTGELYHNRAGAVSEALHNFVQPLAVTDWQGERLRVLDVPFGLGYNTFVLLQELIRSKLQDLISIEVVAVEQDMSVLTLIDRVLLDDKFALLRSRLEFSEPESFELGVSRPKTATAKLNKFCHALQNSEIFETRIGKTDLSLTVKQGDMRSVVPSLAESGAKFDYIMHDPFSPNKMPELWTIDLFQRYMQMLSPCGRLTTYSMAFAVRSALLQTGFTVYDTESVGAKNGGTLAVVAGGHEVELNERRLSRENMERVNGRSGVPYRDPFFRRTRAEIRQRRLEEQEDIFPLKKQSPQL